MVIPGRLLEKGGAEGTAEVEETRVEEKTATAVARGLGARAGEREVGIAAIGKTKRKGGLVVDTARGNGAAEGRIVGVGGATDRTWLFLRSLEVAMISEKPTGTVGETFERRDVAP